MVIKKILNNNAAAVINEKGKECIVIGKGIAFGKKVGESIDTKHAVKIYKSTGHGLAEKLSDIVENIPFEHVKVCNEIVSMARKELGYIDDKIFLTLIDHISFAIERHNKGLEFADIFWDLQKLYPDEYNVGLKSLDIIEKRLGVCLPRSEATLIAFHILNANGTSMQAAKKSLKLINGILEIVRKHFDIEFDEDTTQFARFMTHLRFFASRVINQSTDKLKPSKANKLLLRLLDEMSAECECVNDIVEYVKLEFGYAVSNDEKSYLLIYIHGILSNLVDN